MNSVAKIPQSVCPLERQSYLKMIIEIQSGEGNSKELCILEFQGEILGELPGNELGRIEFSKGYRIHSSL